MKAKHRLKPTLPGFTDTDLRNAREEGTSPFCARISKICLYILTLHHTKSEQAIDRLTMTGHPQIRAEATIELFPFMTLYNHLLRVLRENCDEKAANHMDKTGTECQGGMAPERGHAASSLDPW